MYKMYKFQKFYFLILIWTLKGCFIQTRASETSLFLIGLNDAGKSDLMKVLLSHEQTVDDVPDEVVEKIVENIYNINEDQLKIVQVPGLGDQTISIEATILGNLENYLKAQNSKEKVVLIVSRWDDDRAFGPNSKFVKMLKSVEYLKSYFKKVIFIFTNVMTQRNSARNPKAKLTNFQNAIETFTNFSKSPEMFLAITRPHDFDLKKNGSNYKLPNKDLCPKNIIDKLIETSSIFTEAFSKPEVYFKNPATTSFSLEENEESKNFQILLENDEKPVKEKNLQNFENLQRIFDEQSENFKISNPHLIKVIKIILVGENITSEENFPQENEKIARILRKIPENSVPLVEKAFSISAPIFPAIEIIGASYDALRDEILTNSPFLISNQNLKFCPHFGYKIPNILEYSKIDDLDIKNSAFYHVAQSPNDLSQLRSKYLENFDHEENMVILGNVTRLGINYKTSATQSAVEEFRLFSLRFNEKNTTLSHEFSKDLSMLKRFDTNLEKSVNIWREFLTQWGTHVIVKAYGGGQIVNQLKKNQVDKENGFGNLRILGFDFLKYQQVPDVEVNFIFEGGSKPRSINWTFLQDYDEMGRYIIIRDWENHILDKPIMLGSDLKIVKISKIIQKYMPSLEKDAEKAIDLYLRNKLRYVDPKITQRTTTKTTTIETTTTPKPTIYIPRTKLTTTTLKPTRITTTKTTITTSKTPKITTTLEYHKDDLGHFLENFQQNVNKTHRLYENLHIAQISSFNQAWSKFSTNESKKCEKIFNKFVPKRPKPYSGNIMGHGYNYFFDVYLQTSPFQEKENKISVQWYIINSQEKNFCKSQVHQNYRKYAEHIFKREKIHFKIDEFRGKLRAGHTIKINGYINHRSKIVERRVDKLRLGWNQFSEDFINDVKKLPNYPSNCQDQNRWQWVDFFEKWGTHFVEEAYRGRSISWTISDQKPSSLRIPKNLGSQNLAILMSEIRLKSMAELLGYFENFVDRSKFLHGIKRTAEVAIEQYHLMEIICN